MRRTTAALAVFLVATLLTLVMVTTASAGKIRVPNDQPTIQQAIKAASPGDTILVGPGIYYESNIVVDKSVKILGDPGNALPGPGAKAPVLDGNGLVADAFNLADGVQDVLISGFEIRNYAANDWTNGTGVGVQAWVPSTKNITVSHNWLHHVGYGVMAGNDGSSQKYALGTHSGWTVEDNIIEHVSSIAVELTDTSDSVVRDNIIRLSAGDTIYENWGPIGIFSWAHIDQQNLTISGNTIEGTTGRYPALYIYAYDDVAPAPKLDGVFIKNNLVKTKDTLADYPYEVCVRDIGGGRVINVHVTENSLTNLRNFTHAAVDARGNWWGQASGPTAGQTKDDFGSGILTSPWISHYKVSPKWSSWPGFWPIAAFGKDLNPGHIDYINPGHK